MIDLRSDTITVPTDAMRAAMAAAPVGDDVWGEDPTVMELQEYGARLFGKEAALYVPSGVMGNQLALRVLCNDGDEVLIDSQAHIYYYEAGAPSVISRVQLRPVQSDRGLLDPAALDAAVRPGDVHFPHTRLLCIENTHNRYGGLLMPPAKLAEVADWANARDIRLHCDGARLWNAAVGAGISLAEYAAPFDTLSVCLSKALGAPVGSLLLGSREHIDKAVKWRKILGGGMRQAGIIAAGGLHAIREHYGLLAEDHRRAAFFAAALDAAGVGVETNFKAELQGRLTNIVLLRHDGRRDSAAILEECSRRGLLLSNMGGNVLRAVFHFQAGDAAAQTAAEVVTSVFGDAA